LLRTSEIVLPIGNWQLAIGNVKGPAPNNAEPETCSPSCLADYFTWPQVALTHHVTLSNRIETHLVNPVNPGILWKI